MNPFQVVTDFENALAVYTGAPYVVTTTSCTMALLLATAWHVDQHRKNTGRSGFDPIHDWTPDVEIPKRTYVGVAYAIKEAGARISFRDEDWGDLGYYQLKPLPVVDSARWFTKDLYRMAGWRKGDQAGHGSGMVCVSFHWRKTLGVQQGGAILLDDAEAAYWLRRARFDGRTEGIPPSQDTFELERAWHAYMSPEVAAAGLVRLASLPRHNRPIPRDDYPDLSTLKAFR